MSRRALCLVNLGSPEKPKLKSVQRFLREFLMDPFVLTLPYRKRFWIVHAFILPFRPFRTLKAYESIWTEEGSPLYVYTKRLSEKVAAHLSFPVKFAMRYGRPSIYHTLEELKREEVDEVLFYPLYPQYALATTQTAVEEAHRFLRHQNHPFSLKVLPPYFDREDYLSLLAKHIQKFWDGKSYLLFSFHSLPIHHLELADPTQRHCLQEANCCRTPSPAHKTCYKYQVLQTVQILAEKLELSLGQYGLAFQSKFGRGEWLGPLLEEEVKRLARQRVQNLTVVAPGFSADCLETLEEIGIRAKKLFLKEGGKNFQLIPCLNDQDEWALLLAQWAEEGQGIPLEEFPHYDPEKLTAKKE